MVLRDADMDRLKKMSLDKPSFSGFLIIKTGDGPDSSFAGYPAILKTGY